MRKQLASLVAAITILIPAWDAIGATFPWKTFSKLADEPSVQGSLGYCPNDVDAGEVAVVSAMNGDDKWIYFYSPETDRIVVAFMPDYKPGALPAEVGVGKVDAKHNDEVPPLRWHKFNIDIDGGSPCGNLFPKST